MFIIFILSSRQNVTVTHTLSYDFIILKTGHMLEYAMLNFLFFRALYFSLKKYHSPKQILILAFFCSILYAITDEIHQLFVPSREGHIRDIAIDAIGIFLMYIYIKSHIKKLRKYYE